MPRPKLIACDLDGTLLNSSGRISERNRISVARAIACGAVVVIVTGRTPRKLVELAADLSGPSLAICTNGAVRYDLKNDTVTRSFVIPPNVLVSIFKSCHRSMPGGWLIVERPGSSAFDREAKPRIESGAPDRWARGCVVEEIGSLLSRPATSALFCHDQLNSEQMLRLLNRRLPHEADVTVSDPGGLLDFTLHGVSKQYALSALASELGIGSADTVAFGDMLNDVDLLRWAGHGVAVANGHPSALAVSNEVTLSNDEDGVAHVLERWF